MNDIHHHITELTRRHVVQTAYQTYRDGEFQTAYHYTQAPALLVQLEHAAPSSSAEARGNAGFGSRPAARIEALDTLMHIDRQAAAWVRALGHDDPGFTEKCVILVGSLYPSQDDATKKQIAADVRSWWNQARIITGYDSPAWRPNASCPLCAGKGALRVKLATRTAVCVDCWETWDEANIALLADHINAENAGDDQPLEQDGDAA